MNEHPCLDGHFPRQRHDPCLQNDITLLCIVAPGSERHVRRHKKEHNEAHVFAEPWVRRMHHPHANAVAVRYLTGTPSFTVTMLG
jgi:hypothetical protein